MPINAYNYEIFPCVVLSGKKQKIIIKPCGKYAKFEDETEYTLSLLPMEHSEFTYIPGGNSCENCEEYEKIVVKSKNGIITFEYIFEDEQQWAVDVYSDGGAKFLNRFFVYSVFSDLYERKPYIGDLHAHSCHSDGTEEPAVVAANYRKAGFDFMGLTDHSKWRPSQEAMDKYAGVPIDLLLCHGEEVHLKGSYIHIVNFGSKYSVNELFYENEENIHRQLLKEAETLKTPEGVNRLEYAYRKWICAEIRKSGGLCIIPHPFWIHEPWQFNMRSKMLDYVFETGIYDAFELMGGQSVHENNLQIAFYMDQLEKGRKIPVVGSSDSHGTDPACYFKQSKTIVFAEDFDCEGVCRAVRDSYSVAIDSMPGESYRVYGKFRLVKYARFLLENYFPEHDSLCYEEGRLMRDYINGGEYTAQALAAVHGRVECYRNKKLSENI